MIEGKAGIFQPKGGDLAEKVFFIIIGLVFGIGYIFIGNIPLIADEGGHVPQISRFLTGKWEMVPIMTMIPGYHLIMAGILKLMGWETLGQARLLSLCIATLNIVVFYRLVALCWPGEIMLRTAQFIFLPYLFTMQFLVYTESWSLLFMLLTVYCTLTGRLFGVFCVGLIALLIRQTNLIWIVFSFILPLLMEQKTSRTNVEVWKKWLSKSWPFYFLFALSGWFLWWNQGIALGEKQFHEAGLNMANVWFFLWNFSLLFWFLLPTSFSGARLPVTGRKWILYIGMICLLAVFFYLSYRFTHRYNSVRMTFYLNNIFIKMTTSTFWGYLAAFTGVLLGLLILLRVRISLVPWWVLPLFMLGTALVHPLVSHRYYLPGLALYLAMRPPVERKWEWAGLATLFCGSMVVFYGAATQKFLL